MELLNDAKKIYKIKPDYLLMYLFYPAAKLLKKIRKFHGHWIAKINHIYFVLIAFCQLELFRIMNNIDTIYKIRLVLFDCIVPKNPN